MLACLLASGAPTSTEIISSCKFYFPTLWFILSSAKLFFVYSSDLPLLTAEAAVWLKGKSLRNIEPGMGNEPLIPLEQSN